MAMAAASGHLEVVQFLRSVDCDWSEETPIASAKNGHLEVLKWVHHMLFCCRVVTNNDRCVFECLKLLVSLLFCVARLLQTIVRGMSVQPQQLPEEGI